MVKKRKYMFVHYSMSTVWFYCQPCHGKCLIQNDKNRCEKHKLTAKDKDNHMWCHGCGKQLKLPEVS